MTPTLAEIYASQGEYEEAMKAYRKLMTLRAADAPQFEKRLAELEALARSRGTVRKQPAGLETRTPRPACGPDEAFRVSDRACGYFIALTNRVRLDLLLAAVFR